MDVSKKGKLHFRILTLALRKIMDNSQKLAMKRSNDSFVLEKTGLETLLIETVSGDFFPLIFYRWVSLKPLTQCLKAFRIWLPIRGNIRIFFYRLSTIIYNRELILPTFFKTKSCNSSQHLLREVTNL